MGPEKGSKSSGNCTESHTDPAVVQMLGLMQQKVTQLAQQQQHQQQQLAAPPAVTFKNFQAVNSPEFKRSVDLVEANAWLKEIEIAFELVGAGDEQKTKFDSYFLKGEANYRWESKKALEGDQMVTWERFTELFLEKYFVRHMKNQTEIKFLSLMQNNLSVAEYEAKFTELARFVLGQVDTDEKRAKRLEQGLTP
ncbi:uncharacterized protein LOC141695393 [Apium graveolens]|uniref:uncharacterized protein LOC141695393 n=1 Tax=Apium graveolens TaxID=4045 RepID=UPI003D7AA66C